ncbi:MAG: hypothetical protein ACRD04_01135 [Terriglobales bacterium]
MKHAHSSNQSSWFALALLLLSLVAFAYSVQVRRQDWRRERAPLVLTRLIPPPALPL